MVVKARCVRGNDLPRQFFACQLVARWWKHLLHTMVLYIPYATGLFEFLSSAPTERRLHLAPRVISRPIVYVFGA